MIAANWKETERQTHEGGIQRARQETKTRLHLDNLPVSAALGFGLNDGNKNIESVC